MPEGFADLHCHLLHGVDDGAKSLDDSLQMARALEQLGFSDVAPSPHARKEYATEEVCLSRLGELQAALDERGIRLRLHPGAENFFFEDGFAEGIAQGKLRRIASGPFVLVEAPYTAPMPALPELVFRMKLKGYQPLIAHPERCAEFERKDRARQVVDSGAALQLDVGALIGRYGSTAKKLAQRFLDEGLYAVAATDLHAPVGALDWVGRAMAELRQRAEPAGLNRLFRENPGRILAGVALEP